MSERVECPKGLNVRKLECPKGEIIRGSEGKGVGVTRRRNYEVTNDTETCIDSGQTLTVRFDQGS